MNKDIFKSVSSDKRDEIKKKIEEYFDEQGKKDYSAVKVTVYFDSTTCTVGLSKMYHGLGALVSFANMKWLSDLLGTEKIDIRNEDYSPGCDSCDYGSSHSVDFVCQDIAC